MSTNMRGLLCETHVVDQDFNELVWKVTIYRTCMFDNQFGNYLQKDHALSFTTPKDNLPVL